MISSKNYNEVRNHIEEYVRSPFAFINTRSWYTKPNSDKCGPNAYHRDGFPDGHLKIMVYPNGLNSKNGGLLIKGYGKITSLPRGAAICFKNSDIKHGGIPGTESDRLCVELTIQRTLISCMQINESHCSGRHLKDPWLIYQLHEEATKKHYINVGSGNRQWGPQWICLDEIDAEGVTKLKIGPDTIFPAQDNSIDMIYTSHLIEHQSDDTVDQIFRRSFRCLKPGGKLIVKIPDFDFFLTCIEGNNLVEIEDIGVNKVAWSWKSKGVEFSLLNACSMMFCGYWNQSYGDHFSKKINKSSSAYHGPAVCAHKDLMKIFSTKNPHLISESLCKVALLDPEFKTFNHRNAWSLEQLKSLAKSHGFEFMQSSKSALTQTYSHLIPDWHSMEKWSLYTCFSKKHQFQVKASN